MRVGAAEAHKVRQVVDGIILSDVPLAALRSLVTRGSAPNADAFERYAALVLRDAGANELGTFAMQYAIHIEPPADGRLARFIVKERPSAEAFAVLKGVEDALNRLICIADAMEDAVMSYPPVAVTNVSITFRGVDRVPKLAGYRSAKVALPTRYVKGSA